MSAFSHRSDRVDWRWHSAMARSRQADRRFTRQNDIVLSETTRFCRLWQASRSRPDRQRLASKMPGLYEALMIYKDERGDIRHTLEARVLANEPADAIAGKMAIRPEVVRYYEQVFFDVRPYLNSADYIVAQVIQTPTATEEPAARFRRLCKLFGYFGGPLVLDNLFHMISNAARPTEPDQVAAFLAAQIAAAAPQNGALAARSLMPTEPRLAADLTKVEARSGGSKEDDSLTRYEANVKELIESLRKHVCIIDGPVDPDNPPENCKHRSPLELKYMAGPVEPRADQWVQLSLGIEPPELAKRLKTDPFERPRSQETGTASR
jgi:hypothetical protein